MLNTIEARAAIRKHTAALNGTVAKFWTDGVKGYLQSYGATRVITADMRGDNGIFHDIDKIVAAINAEHGAGTARVTRKGYIKINASR